METNPHTAHTNMDVYDHVLEDDLKQSAAVAASFIYQAAMRNEKLPRKALTSARGSSKEKNWPQIGFSTRSVFGVR
jgi:carboxypeptidase Q